MGNEIRIRVDCSIFIHMIIDGLSDVSSNKESVVSVDTI